jgi:hypothetical protein
MIEQGSREAARRIHMRRACFSKCDATATLDAITNLCVTRESLANADIHGRFRALRHFAVLPVAKIALTVTPPTYTIIFTV